MNTPARIERGLTDEERQFLVNVVLTSYIQSNDLPEQQARDELDDMAGQGRLHFTGNAVGAQVTLDGRPIVDLPRDLLAFYAYIPDGLEQFYNRPDLVPTTPRTINPRTIDPEES